MKRIATFCLVLAGFVGAVDAAVPGQRRGSGAQSAATAQTQGTQKTTAARAATGARTAPRTTAARSATPAQRTTAARAATPQTTTVAKPVAARAATSQKVIGTGTKVASAAKNIVVSEECQAKFDGCMDAFCMLDNETGGRCLCSDKNAEFDDILAQIEHLDQQSYKMATVGVERLEMGDDAEAAMAMAQKAADAVTEEMKKEEKKQKRSLDLSMWDANFSFDDGSDIFAEKDEMMVSIEGKEGDALYSAAAEICTAQIPECKSELNMLRMVYGQRIKSDCAAYENSLKQQKNASQQKLLAAEKALRETALEQYRSANKYDLGQCTVEFKKCMQTTAGCGEDFAGCASVVAMDNTNVTKSTANSTKTYSIKGASTTIQVSASTYDALVAKKPLCENVTKSCVNVANQVWDTFLREVAPQLKSAELIAEDNARQNCIGNVSDCFQKACKEHMDPKDPDGSYDICLTRPETMLSFCKIPLNACGIDASSAAAAEQSNIWDYVLARLSSMRVDSCTTEVKECLQSEDRCGKDYTQCVGLDTDSIVRMCPYDKLVGCQQKYGESEIKGDAVYDELARLVQGIFLNIDNSMMELCQNAANEAMIKVCGDSENCEGLTVDDNLGTRSLEYKICEYSGSESGMDIDFSKCRTDVSQILDSEIGRVQGSTNGEMGPVTPFAGVLDGTIYWESVLVDETGKLDIDSYWKTVGTDGVQPQQKEKINSELAVLQNNINTAIQAIEADPTVQFCMTGREVQGMNTRVKDADGNEKTARQTIGGKDAGRFPELTKQMRTQIATAALKIAKDNYYKKYDSLNEKLLQDYVTLGERIAEIQGENVKDVRREFARQACVSFADAASLPKSSEPPKGFFGKVAAMVAIAGAAVAAPFTGGLSVVAVGGVMAASTGAVVAGAATAVAGIGLLGNIGSGKANGADGSLQKELMGSKQLNQWNYKEVITSTFNWDTMICTKCTRSQQCKKTKNPWFGKKYCKTWADAVESCQDTQF